MIQPGSSPTTSRDILNPLLFSKTHASLCIIGLDGSVGLLTTLYMPLQPMVSAPKTTTLRSRMLRPAFFEHFRSTSAATLTPLPILNALENWRYTQGVYIERFEIVKCALVCVRERAQFEKSDGMKNHHESGVVTSLIPYMCVSDCAWCA